MLLALFFTFHRTSWLALMVGVIYLLWKGRTRLSLLAAIVPVLFVAGLTFSFWGGDVYYYSTGERYTGIKIIWQGAVDTARDNTILGTGLGNSAKIMEK